MPRLDVCPFFCLVMSQCCMDVCNVMYSGREQDTGNMLILGLKVLALQRTCYPALCRWHEGIQRDMSLYHC